MAKGAKEFSITRTRASFKPRVSEEDIPFFNDEAGNILVGLSGDAGVELTDRPPIECRHLPYANLNAGESGAGAGCAQAKLLTEADLPEKMELDYQINGGFNNNCIIVTWDDTPEHKLEWVLMKTFTGTQMKYALPKKRNRMVFALADEDAFVYCNKEPCVECGFRCKNGFVLYASFKGLGVVRKPVERISMLGIIGDGGLEAGTTDHRS
jgi:hypothetical protein